MSLLVNSITPVNAATGVPIDTSIVIEFDQDVDPFTVAKGISIYTQTDQQWIGSEMSVLDTKYREVMDIGEDYSYLQYNFQVAGNVVTITPLASLLPERKYYIAIFPGNDSERYVSAKTYSDITYTRVGASEGILNVLSAFNEDVSASYSLTFDGALNFDVIKDGSEYIGSFPYTESEEVDLGFIKVSITGTFDNGDIAVFDTFASDGVDSVYRNSFTTSQYETAAPEKQSVIVTNLAEALGTTKIRLVNSIPDNLSINNKRVNPIVLKFNQELESSQVLTDLIDIKRQDLITGDTRKIGFYYQISGNTAKLFMINAE